ncbi:MAG: PAS domain S-box protein [Nitrospinae bacterium]|nr:PAS domain S-box protein [Nitrospinota bacterium]
MSVIEGNLGSASCPHGEWTARDDERKIARQNGSYAKLSFARGEDRGPTKMSIRAKLILFFTAILFLIAAFNFIYYPKIVKENAMSSLNAKVKNMAEMLALGVGIGLGGNDFTAVNETLNFARDDRDFSYIAVFDAQNKELAKVARDQMVPSSSPNGFLAIELDLKDILNRQGPFEYSDRLFFVAPILYQDVGHGKLVLGLSLENLHAAITKNRIATFAVCFAILILGAISAVIFSNGLAKRLNKIIGAIDAIADGNLKQEPLAIRSTDEIGHLGRVFNKFLSRTLPAIEQSPVSIVITDKEGKIEYVNPRFTKYTGYEFDEVLGKTPGILKSGKHPPEFYKNLWDTILSGRRWQGEMLNKNKSGGLYWEFSTISPVKNRDGIITHFIGVKEDISERKCMEEASRRSEELVRSMVANAMDGIITIHDDGKIESINPAAERIFGYREEELAGKNVSALMPEPYRKEHDGYIKNYLRTGQSKILGVAREVPALRKSGETFPLEISVSETLLENRRMFTGIVRDISERKRAEEELKLYRDHLERLVEERTAELKKVHERFVHAEKLSALGKLTGAIAHEFNNPIYGLRNIMDQTRENPLLTEEQKYLLNLGVKECDRMADLVRKLRGFYQPSTGTAERLDVHQVLDDMILLIQKQLKTRKIELIRDYAPNLPRIVAVEDQMKQVFLNLLQNAEESISGEGGTITVATESPSEDCVKISIRDTGDGIPPENIPLIFEPFFTTKSVKGTGLGLFVCYGIVKAHGGNIEMSSDMGRGTAVAVTLPARGGVAQ